MWDKIIKLLPNFSEPVLTGLDAEGYPFSMRCEVEADTSQQIFKLKLPAEVSIQPGAASLLCHQHDEKLDKLKAFGVRGTLEQNEQGWYFRPQKFVAGAGTGGALGDLKIIAGGRRSTKAYLEKRKLARPQIPWDKIKAVKKLVS